MTGGYDDGYSRCSCFWGREPGSLLPKLVESVPISKKRVLDAGCGEGKNAVYMARQGALVTAVEASPHALANAVHAWPDHSSVSWIQGDIRGMAFAPSSFDIVIMYGLLHCLASREEIRRMVLALQAATADDGFHVLCAFNDRMQDLSAHPGFHPTLLSHEEYVAFYRGWDFVVASDSDLHEVHPHNEIPHAHALTRLIARKGPRVSAN